MNRRHTSFWPSLIAAMWFGATVDAKPRFAPMPCSSAELKPPVRCGTIAVPEDPSAGDRSIALNVVVVPALEPRGGSPPLFHLDGGPGISATNAAGFYLGPGAPYRQLRDVVLFDQRGTGGSNPLRCPALERRHPLQEMYSAADVASCLEDLRKRADLAKYSTEFAASDIDRVREALGYSRVDLWSISYGTRLAQEYIKRFPEKVRSAVLIGFVPLDYRAPLHHAASAQRVVDLLLYKCQADRECSGKYPNLREEWRSLLPALDLKPDGIPRGPFAEALRTLLGTAAAQREVPFIVHAAAAGDFALFRQLLPKDSSQFAEGLYLTIVCSEGVARIASADIPRYTSGTFLGEYRVRQELAACAKWPAYTVRADFYEPPKRSPPLLVLSGEMDNVAAPEWGYEFCASLPKCRFVSIPDLGHGPFDLDEWSNGQCLDEIAARFYEDQASVDVSCLKGMRPPGFR